MASAATPSSRGPAPSGSRPDSRRSLRQWLILGACFGIGYGVTDRLVNLPFTPIWTNQQRFEVRPSPGTELETLRRQSGESSTPIRADLDQIELERQQKREAAELERRRAELEDRSGATGTNGEPLSEPSAPESGPGDLHTPPEAPALPPAATPPAAAPADMPAAPTTRPLTPAPVAAPATASPSP